MIDGIEQLTVNGHAATGRDSALVQTSVTHRAFKGVPAPGNLMLPPQRYVDEKVIECGAHSAGTVKASGADAACCLQHAEAIGRESERTS